MPNLLPTVFIILAALALVLTLLWLWQSLRLALAHTSAETETTKGVAVSPERAALLAEKQALLLALKDLAAERDSGKLSNEDFRELNEQYRQRARKVLRDLDALLAEHRAEAKRMLAAAAAPDAAPAASSVDKTAVATCSGCGTGNDTDAVFCKKCGTRLSPGDAS